jgi:hypothetical protein
MKGAADFGYSGTALPKKLGIKPGSRLFVTGAPSTYKKLLRPLPAQVSFKDSAGPEVDIAQVFVTEKEELAKLLAALRNSLNSGAAVWVSWPKKTARVHTTVDEDTVRALALPLGFVDIKVCAIDQVWSGLKLVIRKELR